MPDPVAARLDLLEATLNSLGVKDLPLPELMKTLEAKWHPPADFLEDSSIGTGQLGDGSVTASKFARPWSAGLCGITFAAALSSSGTAAHLLATTPSVVIVSNIDVSGVDTFRAYFSSASSTLVTVLATAETAPFTGTINVPFLAVT